MNKHVHSFSLFVTSKTRYQAEYIESSLLFGRGPNRVMETACFDANVQ